MRPVTPLRMTPRLWTVDIEDRWGESERYTGWRARCKAARGLTGKQAAKNAPELRVNQRFDPAVQLLFVRPPEVLLGPLLLVKLAEPDRSRHTTAKGSGRRVLLVLVV